MDGALARFLDGLPGELRAKLDFTPESFEALEGWALSRYASLAEARAPSEAATLDGASRYVGQVFRKSLGGRWFIDHRDPKNAFYGLPQLEGLKGQVAQICPLTLVTASLDRRTGTFISTVYRNHLART
ncbi:hypothetical protein G3573_08980 [Caulobacter sp. 17J65-9]|nr:hypothetical protein [Caulobacter sp. 17J65-9]